MKRLIGILGLCFCWFCAFSQKSPNLYEAADQVKMNQWVDSVFRSMSVEERIGQLFMVVSDPRSDSRTMQMLLRYLNEAKIGGVLFHKGTPAMQAEVTNRLQQASRIPLFIGMDGEWGLSMRLVGTTRFPKNMMLGAIGDTKWIEIYGEEMGRQCKEMGIQLNFAPSLDVNSNTENPVIGLRSFGEDPEAVAVRGIAYARGLERTGVFSVAKHFPGHGDTFEDSHYALPVLRHDLKRLETVEMYPFQKYIEEGFAAVMVAHLEVPELDPGKGLPASLSRKIVSGLLQENMQFRGLCITDALAMKGAAGKGVKENLSVKAILAGNDILLAPASPLKDFQAVREAVESGLIPMEEIDRKCRKILSYKYIAGLNEYHPIELKGLEERLNSPHAAWIAAKLNAESITLVKNEGDILPLRRLDKRKIAVLSIGDEIENEFQAMLNKYDTVADFSITLQTKPDSIRKIYAQLENYDVIICGIHTVRIPEEASLHQLAADKDLIYAFFTLPYFCNEYSASVAAAKAVLIGYESTPLALEYTAQAIFGGIAVGGKLPVSIPSLYARGSGLATEKTRLGFQEPEEVALSSLRLQEIDSIVQEGLREKAYPGCQILVAKDGWVIYQKAFGSYDYQTYQPVTNQSVYDLASVSKAAGTLLAVMKAYDDKKFALTDRIASYIPELQHSDKSDILVRDLLFHQSGLTSSLPFYLEAIDGKSYSGRFFSDRRDANHPVQLDTRMYVRDKYRFSADWISDHPAPGYSLEIARHLYLKPSFKDSILSQIAASKLLPPGKYVYSCLNFILLGQLTENLLKQPMDSLLYASFYDRLGAWHTRYNPLQSMDTSLIVPTENDLFLRRQLLRGYVHDEAAAFQGGVSGNAGLFSNANDLAKELQMLLDQGVYGGERYLSEATCRLFTGSKSPVSRRGLGFDRPEAGRPALSPCGALAPSSVYGHTGYTGTCFWVDPENRLIYIFLTNRVNPTRMNTGLSRLHIRTRIQDVIYKSMGPDNNE